MKKEIIKYTAVFFTLIAVFFTYSVLVCLLPTENIKKNIKKDANSMFEVGDYPYAIINKKQYQMDDFTDALILNINYSIDKKKPVRSVMLCEWSIYNYASPQQDLIRFTNDEKPDETVNYVRYWHGNSFLLRPLLLFADYSFIRWILYTVSSILLLILGIKLHKNLGMRKTAAFMFGLLCVNIIVTQFSIQFFPVITLSTIACILMCKYFKDRKKILLISFIFGCLTAYLDLFTTPLLVCGLPLLVYLSLAEEDTFKNRFLTLILFGFLWAIGYFFTWASKWGLATLLTDINVFENAFNQFIRWSDNENYSRFHAIIVNFNLLPIVVINLIFILLLPLVILFFNKKAIKTNLLLLIVAALPYLWYIVIAKPCWWHWWFAYRTQAISIIAVLFIFINFISWNKIIQSYDRCKMFFLNSKK